MNTHLNFWKAIKMVSYLEAILAFKHCIKNWQKFTYNKPFGNLRLVV